MNRKIISSAALTLAGAGLLALAIALPGSPAILAGFGGGCIGGGLAVLAKELYWSSGDRVAQRAERLELEQINRTDELKQHLRYRAGWLIYLLTLGIITISLVVFAVFGTLNMINARLMLAYLGSLWIFMYVAGIVAFRVLQKRYE